MKRKPTKTAKKLPKDFDKQKCHFLDHVTTAMRTHNISADLVINFDETGLHIVPVDK